MTAFKSKWFVGSSNMSKVGSTNRARAKEILILQPPLNIFVGLVCISTVNPKPYRILRALASMESAPILVNSSTTTPNRSITSLDSSPASTFVINSFSSSMRSQRRLSAFKTASTAGVLSATTSCSTYKKSMRGGSIKSLEAIIFNNVDFPLPLAPTNPYRRPWPIVREASLNRIFPAAEMEKFGILISNEFSHWGSFSLKAVWEQAN
mmetsp:Transcript_34919/g.84510  ORF Transcript_34919/g.84510 Transcript_34919/m.84510 type:complete len:208 (-) Transcript_34919:1118-1741(-)